LIYKTLYTIIFTFFFIACSSDGANDMTNSKRTKYTTALNLKGYFPKDEDIYFKNVVSANKDNWCSVVKNANPRTLIELEDGVYMDYCPIKNKSYITIKAKNQYGVKYEGDDFFLVLQDNNHHINLLGIETSSSSDKVDAGLLKTHGYGRYDNHHVYVKDCWVHHSGSAILTSPRNHDITVDHCLIHDIKKGYFWYAMGWHLSLVNSVLYHPENNGMSIRGHFPLNKYWSYEEAKTADVRDEADIENLPKDEWTHYVANNFFGKGFGREASRSWERGSAVAFYQGRDNSDGDDAYLPAQNVVIENNIFHDITPSVAPNGEVFDGAITVDAEAGFADADISDIDGIIKGTIIKSNISDVKLLKSFWQKPDYRLLTLSNNTKEDSEVLEKEFFERIDELKKSSF